MTSIVLHQIIECVAFPSTAFPTHFRLNHAHIRMTKTFRLPLFIHSLWLPPRRSHAPLHYYVHKFYWYKFHYKNKNVKDTINQIHPL